MSLFCNTVEQIALDAFRSSIMVLRSNWLQKGFCMTYTAALLYAFDFMANTESNIYSLSVPTCKTSCGSLFV